MPDVDMDFEDSRRDEVIRYIAEKYGDDHVAQIITFGSMGPRLAVRDAGRAMNVPIPDVDRVAKLIDATRPIRQSLESNPDLSREYEDNATIHQLIDTAMGIEGLSRHGGTHAAAVVVSKDPLRNVVPLQRSTEGDGLTTQFDVVAMDTIGLLKLDVLGLRTLTVMKNALELIRQSSGKQTDLDDIPFDDAATFALLSRGETAGVFQLESSGMRQVVTELKPDCLEDIIALVALYRPGPMARIPDYIAGKHGTREIAYLHPALEPILKDTYGVIVYQEQVMTIAGELAGFSMGAAEALLYAMRKKNVAAMATVRADFLEGAEKNDIHQQTADAIYEQMAEFAGYGFNKAHAASYAINAYQTAYLKTHYPAQFMAAQLTSIMDDKDKVAAYVQECRRMGIDVLAPDVNRSEAGFTVAEGDVSYGLAAVKHVSTSAVGALASARAKDGPFADVFELCSRLEPGKLSKLALESLARAGALSSLPGSRAQQLAAADQALEWGARVYRDRETGQTSLFGTPDGSGSMRPPSPPLPPGVEFPSAELLAMEKDRLGAYLSGHPLDAVAEKLAGVTTATLAELAEGSADGEVVVGGILTSVRKRITRTGRMMGFFTLEDVSGVIEATLLPEPYEKYGITLAEQSIVVVRGRAEFDDRWREERDSGGQHRLLADHVARLDDEQGVTDIRYNAAPPTARNGRNGRRNHNGQRANGKAANGQTGNRQAAHAARVSNGATHPPPASVEAATPAAQTPPASAEPPSRVHIRVPAEAAAAAIERLKEVIGQFYGDTEVLLHVQMGADERRIRLGREFMVAGDGRFTQVVEGLLGEGAVWLE
jgi:DNA polymerase-3 subunit alpha